MTIEQHLQTRSNSTCELCTSTTDLSVYEVPPTSTGDADHHIHVCSTCLAQIDNEVEMDPNHWRCLNDSMWSQVPAVQVMAWRMLNRLRKEVWPIDLIEMLYLDDETMAWAKATEEDENEDASDAVIHVDCNGVVLEAGDTVVLIKDLNVKGANFTAKRGTAVRRISLVADNPEHIEGRVSDQRIVILTKFVKKSK